MICTTALENPHLGWAGTPFIKTTTSSSAISPEMRSAIGGEEEEEEEQERTADAATLRKLEPAAKPRDNVGRNIFKGQTREKQEEEEWLRDPEE